MITETLIVYTGLDYMNNGQSNDSNAILGDDSSEGPDEVEGSLFRTLRSFLIRLTRTSARGCAKHSRLKTH